MRQSGEDGGARLAAQPLHHGSQVEALVVRACLEIGELPQNDCLLIVQHASMQQLGEHAFDAVGVFRDVFQKKYALFDGGEIGGTQQAGEYAQIAAPQSGILHRFFQQCRAGFWLFFFADDHFQLRSKSPRPGRNPRTGELISIDARRVVTFHASHKLKAVVQGEDPAASLFTDG